MPSNDDDYPSAQARTPSGWHDDASSRDAGHDDMQIAVFDYLNAGYPLRTNREGFAALHRVEWVFEFPLTRRGHIIAWADIYEHWLENGEQPHPSEVEYFIYEIKPKIYSVGATVRQCKALQHIASIALSDDHTGMPSNVIVWPTVLATDPKLSQLCHILRYVAVWNGASLEYRGTE